jgi:hypothetical protein
MSTEIQLSPTLVNEQNSLASRVSAITEIHNDAAHIAALETIKDVKAVKKSVEEFFAPMVESAHKAHKAITTARNNATKPLDEMESALKAKVLPYVQAKAQAERAADEERQRVLREEAELERALGNEEAAQIARHEAAKIVPGKAKGTRDNWKWRVVDADAIPRHFLKPDEAVLDAFAKANKGTAGIPGIEFYNDPIVVAR